MEGIVLYKSKYGHTKQYAVWLAEALDWELRDLSAFKKREISNYDQVIFGTGVYMGKMNKLKKVLRWFKNKPINIFACAGNPGVEKDIEDIKNQNFTEETLNFHQFFYLPGGLDFSLVKGIMGKMVHVFKRVIEKKKNKTKEEEEILKGFSHPTYFVDQKHIKPMLDYIQEHEKE